MKSTKGFTLIELLIVVAIIAILAAIAVPNFLEAQVRSKVSRQWANMRTTATAMESYYVDNNKFPLCTENVNPVQRPSGGNWAQEEKWKFWPGFENSAAGLTTPVAYLTSVAALEDIFRLPLNFDSPLADQIMYLPSEYYKQGAYDSWGAGNPAIYPAQVGRYGHWVIRSAGPDNYYQNHLEDRADAMVSGQWYRASYDPTNGTVSSGDIMRSQKDTQVNHEG